MDAWRRDNERRLSEMRRRKPHQPSILHLTVNDQGDVGPTDAVPPDQLHLEITFPTGETVAWFDDLWWIDVLQRWRDRPLSVHMLPTPHALLHPVVWHHMEMLRRVVPRWRRVGHAYLDDVLLDGDVVRLATAPYDEVCVIDGFRPDTGKTSAELRGLSFHSLCGRVMRLQSALETARPVLVRILPHAAQGTRTWQGEDLESVCSST